MLVLVFSQISKSKGAGCPVNVCGLDFTGVCGLDFTGCWRKSKRAKRPVSDCGSVCRRLACGINL